MSESLSDIKKRLYRLIPGFWKEPAHKIARGLIDGAFIEGRTYEMEKCINNNVEVKHASSDQ